jgi:diamine N-acetyltransferase
MKRNIIYDDDNGLLLRPLTREDLHMTLDWRNRPEIRKWFKTSDILTFDQHVKWYKTYFSKTTDYTFIAMIDGRAVGQLAVYAINADSRTAEVGRFISAPSETGKGHMKRSLHALKLLCRDYLKLETLKLEVVPENTRAIHLYLRMGFEPVGYRGSLLEMRCEIS